MADSRVYAQQNNPALAAEGTWLAARADRTGIPFTTTWKEALVFEGRVFSAMFGEMGATDLTEITGGGTLQQADFCVSVPTGTALIPLEINIAAKVPFDTQDDDGWVVVIGDPDAAFDDTGTVVSVTANNNITDGGVTGVATVFENGSVNHTAPTATKILICGKSQQHGYTSGGGGVSDLNIHWVADVPIVLTGPAAFYGFAGGNDSVTFVASVTWAEVPVDRFTV